MRFQTPSVNANEIANGVMSALVAITAGCPFMSYWASCIIGGIIALCDIGGCVVSCVVAFVSGRGCVVSYRLLP